MHKDFSAILLFRTELPFMTWFIMTQKKWLIYTCIPNRLHLQSVTKTVPWTDYFWDALLLTLFHPLLQFCVLHHHHYQKYLQQSVLWLRYTTALAHLLLTYSFQLTVICLFIYSLNTLSFACSLTLSHCHAFICSLMLSHPQVYTC